MRRYAELLRVPHVAAMVGASLLSRLPIGINALALVLFLRHETGSFAVAGGVTGALAAGAGLGTPVIGRLVDRFGARVLLPLAVAHAIGLGLLVAGGKGGAPTAALVAVALVAGASIPPTTSVLRTLWPQLLGERVDLRQAAFALDSVGIEALFIVGPAVTGVIAAVASPEAALGVSAFAVLAGTASFLAQPLVREAVRGSEGGKRDLLGALRSAGVRTIVITSVPPGIALGMTEVALPAFCYDHGDAARAGLLLAVWSVGSAAGGLVYGAMHRPDLARVHLIVTILLPVALVPLAVAPSIPAMALLVIPAGVFIAPLLATRNEMIGWVAPPDALTEAYTWPQTALVGGLAIGAAVAGALVQAVGPTPAFLVAAGVAGAGALVAVALRRSITPPASYAV
jgi:MFS family permease